MKERTLKQFTEIFIQVIRDFEKTYAVNKTSQAELDQALNQFIEKKLLRNLILAVQQNNLGLVRFMKTWLSLKINYTYFKSLETLIRVSDRKENLVIIPSPGSEIFTDLLGCKCSRFDTPVIPDTIPAETRKLIQECCIPSLTEGIYIYSQENF